MKNIQEQDNIKLNKTDYDNEYNLRGFYNEYLKAQEMIRETRRLYFSFVASKLKPLSAFAKYNTIDRLKLYNYSIIHNRNKFNGYYKWFNDDIYLYLARFVYPIVHKRLNEETKKNTECPWEYPIKYVENPNTDNGNNIKYYECFGLRRFSVEKMYNYGLIEKKSQVLCDDNYPCPPSVVGCRNYDSYDYKRLSDEYRKKEIKKYTIFGSEEELKESYKKWHNILYKRFDEILVDVLTEYAPQIEYTNKFSIMVDMYELTKIVSDLKQNDDTVLPKSIWNECGIIRNFIPYDGYDDNTAAYNKHYGKILDIEFDISKFKRDDVSWYKFLKFLIYHNMKEIYDYVDKSKLDAYVSECIGNYFIDYISCFDMESSNDETGNLYILYNNEPKFVCRKDELYGFDIKVDDNKLICTKEDVSSCRQRGPRWLPIKETTTTTVLIFDIDTNELLNFYNYKNSREISYK